MRRLLKLGGRGITFSAWQDNLIHVPLRVVQRSVRLSAAIVNFTTAASWLGAGWTPLPRHVPDQPKRSLIEPAQHPQMTASNGPWPLWATAILWRVTEAFRAVARDIGSSASWLMARRLLLTISRPTAVEIGSASTLGTYAGQLPRKTPPTGMGTEPPCEANDRYGRARQTKPLGGSFPSSEPGALQGKSPPKLAQLFAWSRKSPRAKRGDGYLARVAAVVIPAALILTFIMVFGSWAFGKECVNVNASWYGKETCKFNPDPRCPTASGIPHFDGSQFIVAHRSWPFHTKVRITYHGKSVVAPVEDRGPAKWTGRSIDMSKAVARALGFKGTDVVCIERL